MPLTKPSKIIKYTFSTVIILLICVIVVVFVRNQISSKNVLSPLSPQETKATLSIQNFRHTAIKDGQKQWSIEASSANLFSEKNTAELSNISASFFIKENESVLLSADKGILRTDTNNMSISGHIIIKFSDYVITTENLNYLNKSHIIYTDTPVVITGKTLTLNADAMSYHLATDTIKCMGNVKGTYKAALE